MAELPTPTPPYSAWLPDYSANDTAQLTERLAVLTAQAPGDLVVMTEAVALAAELGRRGAPTPLGPATAAPAAPWHRGLNHISNGWGRTICGLEMPDGLNHRPPHGSPWCHACVEADC